MIRVGSGESTCSIDPSILRDMIERKKKRRKRDRKGKEMRNEGQCFYICLFFGSGVYVYCLFVHWLFMAVRMSYTNDITLIQFVLFV